MLQHGADLKSQICSDYVAVKLAYDRLLERLPTREDGIHQAP
jgi:hypothetical protein